MKRYFAKEELQIAGFHPVSSEMERGSAEGKSFGSVFSDVD